MSESFPPTWLSSEIGKVETEALTRLNDVFNQVLTWNDLKYVLAFNEDGRFISKPVGPDGDVIDTKVQSEVFHNLSNIVEDYLKRIKYPAPVNITIELENELLLVFSKAGVRIVAAFECISEQGVMSEQVYKRVSALT